jgi:hypothetical protein
MNTCLRHEFPSFRLPARRDYRGPPMSGRAGSNEVAVAAGRLRRPTHGAGGQLSAVRGLLVHSSARIPQQDFQFSGTPAPTSWSIG